MKKNSNANLRKQAEKKLKEKKGGKKKADPNPDTEKLLHELQVHQVELEIQNQELIDARSLLEKSLADYSELFDFAPTGYFTVGLDGKIKKVSLRGSMILETERLFLDGVYFEKFVCSRDKDVFRIFLSFVQQAKKKGRTEVSLLRQNGGNLRVRIEGDISADGLEYRLAVIDINELHESHEILSEKEAFLAEAQRIGKLGWFVLDLNSRTWKSSSLFDDILGIEKGTEKTFDLWIKMIHPDWLDACTGFYHPAVIDYRKPFSLEYKIIRPHDGEERWVLSRAELKSDSKGKPAFITGVLMDITERKETEIELKKLYKELEELNASKDRFFSLIAHDLKSPFTNLLGMSEILSAECEKMDSGEIKTFASNIYLSASQVYSLLDELLEWAHTQLDKISISPESFLPGELFADEIKILKSTAAAKNITLNFGLDDSDYLIADKNMFKTVLRNLISNAIKFTNRKGTINVSNRRLNGFMEFSVSDTGIGMDEITLRNMFVLGKKHNRAGTDNERGTGLGLILCREFVAKHGGTLKVESSPGKGSTFKFTFPCENTGRQ